MKNSEKQTFFKICPMCATTWKSRDIFLDDSHLVFNGYQPNFEIIEEGLFYFTTRLPPAGRQWLFRHGISFPFILENATPDHDNFPRNALAIASTEINCSDVRHTVNMPLFVRFHKSSRIARK